MNWPDALAPASAFAHVRRGRRVSPGRVMTCEGRHRPRGNRWWRGADAHLQLEGAQEREQDRDLAHGLESLGWAAPMRARERGHCTPSLHAVIATSLHAVIATSLPAVSGYALLGVRVRHGCASPAQGVVLHELVRLQHDLND